MGKQLFAHFCLFAVIGQNHNNLSNLCMASLVAA